MSCSDVQTIKAGNGSQLTFSFDFPYIFKSEIHVYFWNATTKEWDEKLTTDSTFPWQITDANPTIVEFTGTAPPSPATPTVPNETTEDNVRIRRITKVDDIRALFNPGSAIRSDDLNKNFEQLRFAIQESNCQGIPDDVDEYLKEYYWNKFDETVYSTETWDSDDDQVATTQAIDARIDSKIDSALTVDIIGADGINVQDDTPGAGQITVGLSDNSVDFDKIKDSDQVKLADQEADFDLSGSDDKIFTSLAAIRRFENYVQDATPATTGIGKGAVWLDVADDKTLSMWDGSAWQAVTSGGTFSNQPKVVYVDASSGSDSNDGHRISRPKKTIKAAVEQINADATFGDGSIVSVAPGIYAETLPIDITKNDVGIIGQSLRTCIIHPKIPTEDQAGYSVDVPESQELQTMFRLNSGSYISNLTLTGLKASGTRGDTGSLYTDGTHGLPPNQGFNFGFFPDAIIKKSPYIQNVTNFSDSQINNVNFTPHTPGEGAAGDLDSAPTGGGILVDGSVPNVNSPLRSMVCDSYTHTALDGPGIFVTNNGYAQCTSSYAFFNHAHITCINGGQANLAASTTDFGRFGLVADGKSSTAIFTSNVDGAAADNATSFNINAPTAASGWFGSATRPQNNMMVTVNSVTYPVLSATARTDSEGGAGWTVTISRPDPTNTSNNLGLNGAISDNDSVSFFLRSMIASSGHTMEYVGSGTNYTALPENGGVPIDANQIKELNGGKVWAATTDHKGTFKLGDFFTVDQQEGSLTVNDGSFKVNLGTLDVNVGGDAVVGADLDMGSNELTSSSGDLKLNASGNVDVQSNRIINVTDPSSAQDAATKNYVDNQIAGIDELIEDTTPQLGGDLDVNGQSIVSNSNGDITLNPNGTGNIVLDGDVGIGTASPGAKLELRDNTQALLSWGDTAAIGSLSFDGSSQPVVRALSGKSLVFQTNGANERMRINSSGNVGIGTTSPASILELSSSSTPQLFISNTSDSINSGDAVATLDFRGGSSNTVLSRMAAVADSTAENGAHIVFENRTGGGSFSEKLRIDSSGKVGIGTTSPGVLVDAAGSNPTLRVRATTINTEVSTLRLTEDNSFVGAYVKYDGSTNLTHIGTHSAADSNTANDNHAITIVRDNRNVGIGTTSPALSIGSVSGKVLHTAGAGTTGARFQNTSGTSIEFFAGSDAVINTGTSTNMTFKINDSEKMRIDSSGNVGIGTTSPNAYSNYSTLTINGTTSGEIDIEANGTLVGQLYGASGVFSLDARGESRDLRFRTNTVERMRIDSSGRLLVGTSSDTTGDTGAKVQIVDTGTPVLALSRNDTSIVSGNTIGQIRIFSNDDSGYQECAKIAAQADGTFANNDKPTRLVFSTTADGASSPTERARIDSDGQFRIFASDTSALAVRNSAGAGLTTNFVGIFGSTSTTNGTASIRIYTNGNVENTNNSYSQLSDVKLKENIVDANSQWDDLKAIQIRNWNFKAETGYETHTQIGVVAQEIETVSPGLVYDTPDRDDEGTDLGTVTKAVNYSVLYVKAVKALQEAMDRIETLETKVAALEAG